jgi:hypothetical protein
MMAARGLAHREQAKKAASQRELNLMPTATPVAASQRHSLFSALRSLADEIRIEKTAAAKPAQPGTKTAAELPADPGGYQGASTHPSADADNHGHALQTGSRASENETDVKADQGPPGVDSTPEGVVKDQDGQQLNIGTEQSATGEDPSVEDDYKGDKDDPGTSHPAKATIGEKYGSLKFADAKAKAGTLAQEILADLAAGFGKELVAGVKVAGRKPAAAPAPAKPAVAPKTASDKTCAAPAAGATPTSQLLQKAANAVSGNGQSTAALRAGYELATALGIDKQAAEQTVQTCLVETLRDADLDATLVGEYVARHKQSQVKPSQGTKRGADRSDAAAGEDHNKPGDGKSGTGEANPSGGDEGGGGEGGGAGGESGGGSLGDVLGGGSDPGQMLGGAGGGGGGAPPPGDPMAGGGGAPGGGGAGGGMDEQAALQELVSALIELGIPPEQLAQLAGSAGAGGGAAGGGMGGGMGGGAPPMGGGAPPMGGPPMGGPAPGGAPPMPAPGGAPGMSEGMKLASAARAFQRSGNFRFKEAADGSEARGLRDEMKVYILDLIKTAQKKAA